MLHLAAQRPQVRERVKLCVERQGPPSCMWIRAHDLVVLAFGLAAWFFSQPIMAWTFVSASPSHTASLGELTRYLPSWLCTYQWAMALNQLPYMSTAAEDVVEEDTSTREDFGREVARPQRELFRSLPRKSNLNLYVVPKSFGTMLHPCLLLDHQGTSQRVLQTVGRHVSLAVHILPSTLCLCAQVCSSRKRLIVCYDTSLCIPLSNPITKSDQVQSISSCGSEHLFVSTFRPRCSESGKT